MPNTFKSSIITANDLLDGEVVYLSQDQWKRTFQEAQIFSEEAEANLALENVKANEVVGAYLIEVQINNGLPEPTHFKEAFRATGPSNYFHGKQENVSV